MVWLRMKRSNLILGLCVGVYVFMFTKLFLYSVQNDNQNYGIIRSVTEELQNASEEHRGVYSASCCEKGNNSANYRNNLKIMFDILKDNSETKSSCKMLMDESILLRALEFGPFLSNNAQEMLPELRHTRTSSGNKTQINDPTNQKAKPKSCQSIGYSSIKLPITALASFPGSGNTWVRHLLEQATGEA